MTFSTPTHRLSRLRIVAASAALALLATACGSDTSAESSTDDVSVEESDVAVDDSVLADDNTSDTDDASDTTDDASDTTEVVLQDNRPVTVTGVPLSVFDSTSPDETIGTPAPVIAGQGFDGTPITFGGATDHATMIVFLAHWCPHCNDEIPELIALNDAGSLPDDLEVIGVSTAVDPAAPNYPPSQWMVDSDWPWTTMADDEVFSAIAAMGGNSFPFTVILDADGNVRARRGGQASAEQTLELIYSALA